MDPGLFESALAALSRAEVRYLVVGGVACALNGFVRATEDVDILVDADGDNVRRLIAALSSVGEGHARSFQPEDFGDEEGAVRLVEDFPIDVFTRMGGRRYADLLPYRSVFQGSVPIPYVNAEGLILLKSKSVREQDRIDVANLREILGERSD